MEQVAYILRQAFPKCVVTDCKFEGVILNLVYKTRATATGKYGEWKTKQQFNPLEIQHESGEAEGEVFFSNKSLFIEFSEELNSAGPVKDEVSEALKDKLVIQFIDAKTKKLANVISENPDEAKRAE